MTEEIELSDETEIGLFSWAKLKEMAMKDDYQNQGWYANLDSKEKQLLEALIDAQRSQGNSEELQPVLYKE